MKAALLAAVFALSSLASAAAAEIDGIWLRDDGNARVRIAPCGDKVCATNLWIGDTSGGEEAGDKLVMTLSRQTDGSYSGTAYDPKRDKNFSMTVKVLEGTLVTRGCIVGGLLCRDVNWTAAK